MRRILKTSSKKLTTRKEKIVSQQKKWLTDWKPEENWNSKIAWRTLTITTFNLTLAFATWFLASALAPKLNGLGFDLTKNQLYWLAAMPGLAGGTLRLIWMFLPPVLGTRKLVTLTSLFLIVPLLGWGVAINNPNTTYTTFMLLAALSGIGGGAFSGFMPSTSYFFPKRLQGTALGLQAGIGNFGVSVVQFVTPWIVGFSLLGTLATSQTFHNASTGKDVQVWYQNAAWIYIPFLVIGIVLAWTMLKSVPVKASFRTQVDIFKNPDTWLMTALYVMTFGTFSGLSAQFGLLIKNLYGAGNLAIVEVAKSGATQLLVDGYHVPDPLKYAFLGPLVGAGARVLFAPLTDRMGGAIWTMVSGAGLLGSIVYTINYLTPDATSAESLSTGFHGFLYGMIAIFFFTGIGNASTFKQMPMIFEPRQAGGVIGWTGAVAAYGPFFFGIGLTTFGAISFYWIGAIYAVACLVITWIRYARKGAPRKS
jgi:NNP family nitrate/nitrite transporter-like MFS transporter